MEKLKNKTVLIVDDDDRNTFALASYLETMEMKPVIAKNGSEAMTLIEGKLKTDIILLDMMMPVMDGFETLVALKEMNMLNIVPVIAITAQAMKGDREKCMNAGAWDYLSKPVDLKLLIEKMTNWML